MNTREHFCNKISTDLSLDPNNVHPCSNGGYVAVRRHAVEVWFPAVSSHYGSVMDFNGCCAAFINMVLSMPGPEAKSSTRPAASLRFHL